MMLLTVCLSSLLLLVRADNSVHILSKYQNGQLITSSMLNWIPDSQYSASKDFVIGGFEIVENSDNPSENTKRPIFVCRALHSGIWVAGSQQEGDKRCRVTLTGSVKSYDHYQLLENVDSAARLAWANWTKLGQPPTGAVASAEKLYIARHAQSPPKPGQSHYIGSLNFQDSAGTITYVKENGEEGTANTGQLLVETEPISYELNAVRVNDMRRRVMKRQSRVLGEAVIKNEGSQPANMAEAFGYTYMYKVYWGQGHAMLKGLATTVTLQNKTRLPDLNWGLPIEENRTSVYTVEVNLEPGTAVNVTLRGDYTDIEVPYSGKLLSHYEDKASVNPRTIDGVRREESISEIKPDFGPVYYLANMSLVPTTEPPPSTEPTTPTTAAPTTLRLTTMPTTIRQQPANEQMDSATEEQYHKDSASIDENSINAKRPEVAPGVQADDGAPESLTGTARAAAPAGAWVSDFAAIATTLGMLIVHRIT